MPGVHAFEADAQQMRAVTVRANIIVGSMPVKGGGEAVWRLFVVAAPGPQGPVRTKRPAPRRHHAAKAADAVPAAVGPARHCGAR